MKKTDKKKSNAVKVQVRYGISIAEPDLFKLIKEDAAKAITEFRKNFPVVIEPRMDDILTAIIRIAQEAQDVWGATLSYYISTGTSPAAEINEGKWDGKHTVSNSKHLNDKVVFPEKGTVSKPLVSNSELKTILNLRSKGMSIKAIGKAIHRAEKVVADIVRTLPKKK